MTIKVPRPVLIVLGVLLGVAVVAGAFFGGRESVDKKKPYREGFAAGEAQGHRLGVALGEHTGETAGELRGQEEGEKKGRAEGEAHGRANGEKTGQNESFEGYTGGWEVGSWYLIKIGTGAEAGLKGKYSIPTRVGPMKIGRAYELCTGGICSTEAPGG